MYLSRRRPSGDHRRSIRFIAYIFLNFITLALSPLQILLILYLRPREVDCGIDILYSDVEDGEISVE